VSDIGFDNSPEHEARVRECAYRLWEKDGRPHGRDVEYWERARGLVANGKDRHAEPMPAEAEPAVDAEEAAILGGSGEFPVSLTDTPQATRPRRKRKE
jgi:hypothetical protein